MDNLILAVNTVLPFMLYISFGYGIRSIKAVSEGFMNELNGLVFLAFFPLNMFCNVYDIPEGIHPNARLVITALASILIVLALLMTIVPLLVKENTRRGVIVQAIYRSNFVLFAVPLTEHIFGAEGRAIAAMMIAFVIPTYNASAVIILEYFHGGSVKPLQLIRNILKNPLILGTLTGVAFRLLHIHLPQPIYQAVSAFATLTTPIALFALGGTLHFAAVHDNLKYLAPALAVKLFVLPTLILVAATLMGFTPIERFILFVLYATPVATSSYAMAKNMGGDGELAAQFVVFSSSVCILTLFIWIFVLKTIGFI